MPVVDVEEERQGNDWLFLAIADITRNHNHIIESLYSMIQANKSPLTRLLSEQPTKISLVEVTSSCALVSNTLKE